MTVPNFSRAQWLGLCASSQADQFTALLENYCQDFHQNIQQAISLRGPEVCLLQLPARVDGQGRPFIFSEATVTRCSLRHQVGHVGHSMVLGRQLQHAKHVAFFDALMHRADWAATSGQAILKALSQTLAEQQALRRAQAEATKVQFFTLAREADASGSSIAGLEGGF
jgi:alpha-D-ribose 1-methylphosphonate 5-triphosphate synthase subunit PhnG